MSKITILGTAAALAFALPATAQEAASGADVAPDAAARPDAAPQAGATWREVSRPNIRFVQRDADGNVLLDSGLSDAPAEPDGVDADTADAIARADGATDADAGTAAAAEPMAEEDMAEVADAASEGAEPDADARFADGPDEAMAEDVAAAGDDQVPGATVPFDMTSFAREMYEQGYRQGYVSAMTRLRSDAARQMRDGRTQARTDGCDGRAQAPVMYPDGDGGTVVVLPRGMSPRDFMRQMSRQ